MVRRRYDVKTLFTLLMCGAALGLVGAEMMLRASAPFQPIVPHAVFNHMWARSAELKHEEARRFGLAPYSRKTNSLGWLRDQDLDEDLTSNERRVFFLGDSFTEGTVPEEQSMPAIVGAFLAKKGADHGLRLTTVNVGTASYSPLIHHLRFEKEIERFEPHVLIVNVDMTDVFDDFLYTQSAERNGQGEIIGVPPQSEFSRRYERIAGGLRRVGMVEGTLDRIGRVSRVASALALGIFKNPLYFSPPDPEQPALFDWCLDPVPERSRPLVSLSMSYLSKLVRAARARGVDVLVTGVPHREQLLGTWTSLPFQQIRAATEEAGGTYLDSFDRLTRASAGTTPDSFYLSGDMHFNAAGYAAWAEGYIDWFEKNWDRVAETS